MENSPISQDKLHLLNNLLDKELEQLKQPFNNDELGQLQKKIFNIEQKMNPLKNEVIKNQQVWEETEETPLKNKYNHSKKRIVQSSKSKSQRGEGSVGSRRVNKFNIEKSIENAESKLNNSMKRTGQKQQRSLQEKTLRQQSSDGKLQEGLNKKYTRMRKGQEEDKQSLMKEKSKNQQLLQEIDGLNKKVKRLQQQIDKNGQLDQDYKRLQENFEKSEYIRQQQKNLIKNLKLEIDQLKKERQQVQDGDGQQKQKRQVKQKKK